MFNAYSGAQAASSVALDKPMRISVLGRETGSREVGGGTRGETRRSSANPTQNLVVTRTCTVLGSAPEAT